MNEGLHEHIQKADDVTEKVNKISDGFINFQKFPKEMLCNFVGK